jgi:hypothetical protein
MNMKKKRKDWNVFLPQACFACRKGAKAQGNNLKSLLSKVLFGYLFDMFD